MENIVLFAGATGKQHTILARFYLSPSQALHKQYKVLLDRAHQIAYTISGSTVTCHEAFLTDFSIFLPAITYVLPLTNFSAKQCHKIQSKPTQIFLQKSGFPSTLCRYVVFGCCRSGGLGFRDLYVKQGILHVTKFVQTLRTPGHSQQLLKLTIDEWQISSGFSSSHLSSLILPSPANTLRVAGSLPLVSSLLHSLDLLSYHMHTVCLLFV